MIRIFRPILVFFTLATLMLSIWSVIGSYKNESFLTQNYLIDFHLTQLDLSKLIETANFSKRDDILPPSQVIPSTTYKKRDTIIDERDVWSSVTSSVAGAISSGTTTSSGVSSVVSQIVNSLSYSDLGLADVYTVGYWGYCRGEVTNDKTYDSSLQKYVKPFDNNKLNITYCTPPKVGYRFDPLTILKHEINNTINNIVDGASVSTDISYAVQSELEVLVDNLSYDNLELPGDLNKKLDLVNSLTKAGFALLLVTAVLSFLSILVQFLGCCFSPDSCCLSFLNFLFEFVIFILGLVGAALITGVYLYVRKEVNDEVKDYGIKSFLSVQLYAFAWSSVVASFLVVIFNLLGHCCGLFGTGRKRYRTLAPPPPPHDHEMGYDHKDSDSD